MSATPFCWFEGLSTALPAALSDPHPAPARRHTCLVVADAGHALVGDADADLTVQTKVQD